ncbi:type VI secretion system protein TssA [Herbaspirillum sp. RTI4]|uniref:type VI secretion system protein TssA n=1 Tax=Herbaspirillum sp. RTI4 TaxID=3048640 RepID=UPI002AB5D833|nr:type VI secretion system protein TssA [Herbaspirillum sp. RTI4]MDY7579042.1 type VI secretion system protein TssA [Herbaspirillum sp. RTI4]MEA9982373.1 type VI secretion system protein TssA [Herbaspirillum sp. RTI4]
MLSIAHLLKPISPSQACGTDLSFSSDFDAIVEARRFDDASLDQGEWVTQIKEADWHFVVDNCARLLADKTKDLRLAVWWTEANAKIRNLRGLGEGYLLLAGLSEQYWNDLHPVPDPDDQELRVGNLSWLLSRSAGLVREMPITEGRHTGFSSMQFDAAKRAGDEKKLAEMESARRKSSAAFYESLLADAHYCRQGLQRMEQAIDEKTGQDGPGFSGIREALEEVIFNIGRFAQEAGIATNTKRPGSDPSAPEAGKPAPGAPQDATLHSARTDGTILSRKQALMQLRLVADFFRRTEPHSPVAYLVEKAADWGDLPLHNWLRTVIKDGAALEHVEELLGLKKTNLPGN